MGERAHVVHLLESEADNYLRLEHLLEHKKRFVLRASHKRTVTDAEGEREPLGKVVALLEGVFERRVALAARAAGRTKKTQKRNLPRDMRTAHLSYAATRVTLHKPTGEQAKIPSLDVHVVHVRELDVPEGAEPVDGRLYTTEPLSTGQDIERVVDFYRARWRIEELLKTGCAFEKRQLESLSTLLNALAIFLPLACALLALRAVALADPKRPCARGAVADGMLASSTPFAFEACGRCVHPRREACGRTLRRTHQKQWLPRMDRARSRLRRGAHVGRGASPRPAK